MKISKERFTCICNFVAMCLCKRRLAFRSIKSEDRRSNILLFAPSNVRLQTGDPSLNGFTVTEKTTTKKNNKKQTDLTDLK